MRLIDADAPKRHFLNSGEDYYSGYAFHHVIDETPTVDAVPVVRCFECKSFDGYEFCNKHGFFVDPDGSFFCKSGERKGDAE